MRKLMFVTVLSASAIGLAACSPASEDATESGADAVAESGTDTATTAESATTGVLDANTVSADQLAAIEGVSPELAEAIVAGQPYASATAFNARLMETLSEEEAAEFRTQVFVPVNLNTATREEIELIPGMTPKMAHEFEEYRPYEDMTEFDREIGKYVDAEEVARFRRYVTL